MVTATPSDEPPTAGAVTSEPNDVGAAGDVAPESPSAVAPAAVAEPASSAPDGSTGGAPEDPTSTNLTGRELHLDGQPQESTIDGSPTEESLETESTALGSERSADRVGAESTDSETLAAPLTPAGSVPSSEEMALPQPVIVEGAPRDQVWGQDRLGQAGKNVAALNQLIEAVTMPASEEGDVPSSPTLPAEIESAPDALAQASTVDATTLRQTAEAIAGTLADEDPDLMDELPSDRPVPADAIKRASEALDAAVNAAPAVIGSSSRVVDDEAVTFVDAEFTHFDGESELESEPEEVASDYSVRVTDPIPVQSLSAPGVSRETSGSVQMPHGTQQPTGGPHGGDDERRSALIATVPAVDDTTPVAAELAMDARRRIELQGRKFPRPPKTRIITVANQKGGVGKTTTTVNVAAGLAQSGLNVLVIDNDPQGNASTALGIEHRAGTPSVYEVLVEGESLASTVQQCPDVPNLWGVPATIDLSGSEIELVSLVSRETRLRKAIDKYLSDRLAAGEERIDYVLIDCPPSLGLLTVNAFVAGREVFIPIQCEYYALEGLSQLLKTIDLIRSHLNPELRVSSILLTMYDGRTNLAQQVAGEVRSHFPAETFKTTIPRSVRISEAPSYGQTVMTYDATSTGALAYLQASRELAERGQGGSSPRRAMKPEAVGAQD